MGCAAESQRAWCVVTLETDLSRGWANGQDFNSHGNDWEWGRKMSYGSEAYTAEGLEACLSEMLSVQFYLIMPHWCVSPTHLYTHQTSILNTDHDRSIIFFFGGTVKPHLALYLCCHLMFFKRSRHWQKCSLLKKTNWRCSSGNENSHKNNGQKDRRAHWGWRGKRKQQTKQTIPPSPHPKHLQSHK